MSVQHCLCALTEFVLGCKLVMCTPEPILCLPIWADTAALRVDAEWMHPVFCNGFLKPISGQSPWIQFDCSEIDFYARLGMCLA